MDSRSKNLKKLKKINHSQPLMKYIFYEELKISFFFFNNSFDFYEIVPTIYIVS